MRSVERFISQHGACVASTIFNRETWFLRTTTLSVCNRCGTAYVPGAPFCPSCGFAFGPHPINPVIVFPPPPPGATKAVIGTSPIQQIIGGIFAIIIGIVILAASSSFSVPPPAYPGAPTPAAPPFGLIGIIPIVFGIVLLALGAMGISIPQSQVTYQTSSSSSPSYLRAGDSAYEYTPKSFLKTCPQCGQEIPIGALACYHCGAILP